MNKPRRAKIAFAVAAGLIAIPAVALLVLLNLDWNRAKPWINARTSEMLGRPFAIVGDLSLTWEKQIAESSELDMSWRGMIPWPHLVAQDIHIGNPPAMTATASTDTSAAAVALLSAKAEMASIKQLDFSLNPWALLQKKIEIPVLRFDSPVVSLQRGVYGNNWTFKQDAKASTWQLHLQRAIFAKGSVHLIDAIKHADVTADVDTINADPSYDLVWQLRGKFNGETVSGNGKAGTVLSLQHQTAPYPIIAKLHIGQTVIAVEGTLTKKTDLVALDMRLKVSGISMGRLYALSGIFLPETPPFTTEGHLVGTLSPHGGRWAYEKFSGKVGSSDIGGNLYYQSKQPRALISGTVVSHLMQFSDLAPVIGADSNASKALRGAATVQPTNKIFPVEPLKADRWTSNDADIKFRAEKIIRDKALAIDKLTMNVRLQDGVLSLLPLNIDMAGGSLSSNITLDGSGKAGKGAIKMTMTVTARRLKLKNIYPALKALQASVGEINGDASLSAVGNSVASLLGASSGEIKTSINQGTVSKLLLEAIGLNIGNVILTRLVGDKQVKLNCMVTDFGVTNGLMQMRAFIIDTDDAFLDVRGNINLAQEQLDLIITSNSKGPRVGADSGVPAMNAGGAIAPASLAPVAAPIPLINSGPGKDSDCTRLLAEARVKPVASAPGKTHRRKVNPNIR